MAGTLFALSPYSLHILGKIPVVGPKVYSHGKLLHESLLCIWSQKGVIGEALLLSMVFHTITVVNVLASGWAVGWIDAPIFELFVVLPVILIVSAVPVTPQAIGFQEGVFVFYLTQLGATLEQALGVALIVRAKSYILAGLGSIIWVSERALGHKISGDGVPTA